MNYEHYALHTDKYQINMMYAHWKNGTHLQRCVFEAYFRKLPFHNGYAVFAGLERVIEYLNHLAFAEEDIAFLEKQDEQYDSGFLDELRKFAFRGNLWSVPEGTVVFANEPLIQVEASVFEAQLIETALLNFINYQTLVATKASRIRRLTPNDALLEFGSRRAQEADAAIWGARAAYIAGFDGTSNMRAGMLFDIPAKGTHSHSWVQLHDDEEEAFRQFVKVLPDDSSLLVDTYDTLRSGVPHAIRIAKEMKQRGKRLGSIRLDSGDLAYLSKKARQMLDEAGFPEVKIVASNDLDEHIILNLQAQGAKIDIWGIGTQLITAADQPSLGGVYKLVAKKEDGKFVPTIKISSNPAKVTTPGFHRLYRIVDQETGKAEGDYIADRDEAVAEQSSIHLFDPVHTWVQKTVGGFRAEELLRPVYKEGSCIYLLPVMEEIRQYHQQQFDQFWEQYLRILNPEQYPVDLSEQVWETRMELIRSMKKNK